MSGKVGVIGYLARDLVFRTGVSAIQDDLTEGNLASMAGGTAVNVTSWLVSLDVSSELIAMAGADPWAESVISEVRDFGVCVTTTVTGRTPVVVSVVTSGTGRQLLVDNGGPFEQAAFPRPQLSLDWIHIPGHVLMRKDLAEQCLAWLNERPGAVARSVDVCSASRLRDFGVSRFLTLLRELAIDVVFMNGLESAELGGLNSVEGIAPIAVIHNGPSMSQLWAGSGWEEVVGGIDTEIPVLDTTGAGDAFAAGFIASFLSGQSARTATVAGHTLAQQAIARIGGNPLSRTA